MRLVTHNNERVVVHSIGFPGFSITFLSFAVAFFTLAHRNASAFQAVFGSCFLLLGLLFLATTIFMRCHSYRVTRAADLHCSRCKRLLQFRRISGGRGTDDERGPMRWDGGAFYCSKCKQLYDPDDLPNHSTALNARGGRE